MEEKKQNAFMSWWMPKWRGFEEKSPTAAKWIYKIFYFFVFSMGVTIIQFIILLFLPKMLGMDLASREAMWPRGVEFDLLGSHVKWCLVGAEVLYDSAGKVLIGVVGLIVVKVVLVLVLILELLPDEGDG